jgi:bifunctional DNA-binding transcriptional regulator/antitoxin component of YhaV-PrlF toxin-antitoxin module
VVFLLLGDLVTFKYFWLLFVRGVVVEEFVVRVFNGGKVTVPKQLRERFMVEDGDYVRLVLVEVLKRGEGGDWVKRRVQ